MHVDVDVDVDVEVGATRSVLLIWLAIRLCRPFAGMVACLASVMICIGLSVRL